MNRMIEKILILCLITVLVFFIYDFVRNIWSVDMCLSYYPVDKQKNKYDGMLSRGFELHRHIRNRDSFSLRPDRLAIRIFRWV